MELKGRLWLFAGALLVAPPVLYGPTSFVFGLALQSATTSDTTRLDDNYASTVAVTFLAGWCGAAGVATGALWQSAGAKQRPLVIGAGAVAVILAGTAGWWVTVALTPW